MNHEKIMIVSDLHLGDPRVSFLETVSVLRRLLECEQPDILILAGDTFEKFCIQRYQIDHLCVLLCSIVSRVVILNGNHDPKLKMDYQNLTVVDQWIGFSGDKKVVVEHGHRFDSWWKRIPFFGACAVLFQLAIYRLFRWDIQHWFRRFSWVKKRLFRQHKKAREAWTDVDIVVTGHTHIPIFQSYPQPYYVNSGDWVCHRTCVTLCDGVARLLEC